MHRITRIAAVSSTILLVAACAKSEAPPADTTTAAMAPAPAPAALTAADLAGKWQFNNVPTTGADTSPTNWVLTATPDPTGWTMEFPSGLKVPLTVHIDGDSIHTLAGPFASQRRKNVKVRTETTLRMQEGKLVGMTTARYDTKGADSVLQLRANGTRIP
jgi:hypothetical protein